MNFSATSNKAIKKWELPLLSVALILFLAFIIPIGDVKGNTTSSLFTVDVGDDTVDFIPGDGYCSDFQGDCSLRAAIQEANALPGDDTINVPLSNVILSIEGQGEDDGETGDLDITGNLTIIGNGATNIDADGIDRVFHIHDGITVTLQALTVINGRTADEIGGVNRHGGGIYNGESRLILQGVEVLNNETSSGSSVPGDNKFGGFGGGIYNIGQLWLTDSQVSNNHTGAGYSGTVGAYEGGHGGGIYIGVGGAITLTNSIVSENTTGPGGDGLSVGGRGGSGGGLYIGQGQGTAELINTVVLNNMTGSGGSGAGGQPGGIGGGGGGIYFGADQLILTNSAVNGNSTGNGGAGSNYIGSGSGSGGPGGGIYAEGFYGDGLVNITGSTINSNHAGNGGENGGRGGHGGGINVVGELTLTMINSHLNSNTSGHGAVNNNCSTPPNCADGIGGAGGEGGGLWIYHSNVSLVNTSINGNVAGNGAYGEYQGGTGGKGGGILSDLGTDSLSLTGCTLSGNTAGNGGNGGVFAVGGGAGGGLFHFGGTASFTNSLVSGNTTGDGGGPAPQGSGGRGGGIYSNTGAVLNLDNSTISSNTTGVSGGGTNSFGGFTGGVVAWGPTEIHNSTISHNSATFKIGGLQIGGYAVNVSQTIIANNTETVATGPDCYGTITSQGYVLVEDEYGCSFTGDTTTNITGVDPALGPLQNNGGNTLTHALLPGSPARDAGNPAVCPGTDQRGYNRPVDGNGDGNPVCDIGAFEAQASESTTVSSLAENTPTVFGATMATLTRALSSTDPLTVTVTLSDQPPGGGVPDPGEMPLFWEIDAAVDSGLDLTLELCYTDEQLGSLVEANLKMYRNDGSGWALMGGTVDTEANCVTLSGVSGLSEWTLATETPTSEQTQWFVYLPAVLK